MGGGGLCVAALVQAAVVAEGEDGVGGGEVGVVGRGRDAARPGGAGEVDCEAACERERGGLDGLFDDLFARGVGGRMYVHTVGGMPSYPRVEVVGAEVEARADGKHHGCGCVGCGEGLATVAGGVDDHIEVVVDNGFVDG